MQHCVTLAILFGNNTSLSRKCIHPAEANKEIAIHKFRDFVTNHTWRIRTIESVMGTPRPGYDLYGRTSHLSEDLASIFKVLGYNSTVIAAISKSTTYHCISSCVKLSNFSNTEAKKGRHTPRQMFLKVPELAQQTIKENEDIQWYDQATAQIILEAFQDDFKRFNFSRNPADLNSESPRMQPEFAAVQANLKEIASTQAQAQAHAHAHAHA